MNVPGFSATPELQAKLDSLDDNLTPINEVKEESKNAKPEVENEEAAEEKDESTEQVEEVQDAEESDETGEDSEESDSEEGYSINEDDEDEEEVPSNSTQETPANNQLTPEQQFVLDNISTFKVRGTVPGNDKVESFDIYTIEQLPAGFKYENESELTIAMKRDNLNEQKAEKLVNDYRSQETNKAAQEFKLREDNADRQDIGDLQRKGELPKFKAQPNSKDFDNDPGVKLANDILAFKEELNQKYLDEYNAGRPYKHIGFEEAFRMYKYQNPDKMDTELQKEDAARQNLAKRTTKAKGSDSQTPSRPRVKPGMTSRDLDNLIDSLDW